MHHLFTQANIVLANT